MDSGANGPASSGAGRPARLTSKDLRRSRLLATGRGGVDALENLGGDPSRDSPSLALDFGWPIPRAPFHSDEERRANRPTGEAAVCSSWAKQHASKLKSAELETSDSTAAYRE